MKPIKREAPQRNFNNCLVAYCMLLMQISLYTNAIGQNFAEFEIPIGMTVNDLKVNDLTGHVYVATDNGVARFDQITEEWTTFQTNDGLPGNIVECLNIDFNGDVYIGTDNKGIAFYNGTSWQPYSLPRNYNLISSISLRATEILFGTDDGKLFWLNRKSGFITENVPVIGYITHLGNVTNGVDDYFYATGTTGGLEFMNAVTFVDAGYIQAEYTQLPSNNILASAHEGVMTYNGTDNGVFILNFQDRPGNFLFTILNTQNSPLPSNKIQAVAVREGHQWYGTNNGLAKLDVNNQMTIFKTTNSNLSNHNVVKLAVDSSNYIWGVNSDHKLFTNNINHVSIEDTEKIMGLTVQNYPNPAYGSTNLMIDLSMSQRLQVDLYDINGKIVHMIPPQLYQPGEHKLALSTKHLNPGIYFYTVRGNSLITTGKLTVK